VLDAARDAARPLGAITRRIARGGPATGNNGALSRRLTDLLKYFVSSLGFGPAEPVSRLNPYHWLFGLSLFGVLPRRLPSAAFLNRAEEHLDHQAEDEQVKDC
jgi:hypothetical protein